MLRIETKATNEKELYEAKMKLQDVLQEVAANGLAPMVMQHIDNPQEHPRSGLGGQRFFLKVSF